MATSHKTDFRKNMDSLLEGCTFFAGTAPAADEMDDWNPGSEAAEPEIQEPKLPL